MPVYKIQPEIFNMKQLHEDENDGSSRRTKITL